MRIESSYPAPIHGISTMAPQNRQRGHAGLQENFRSDPVHKLTRRPSSEWVRNLSVGALEDAEFKNQSYRKDNKTHRLVLNTDLSLDKLITGFVDDVEKAVNGREILRDYLDMTGGEYSNTLPASDVEMQTIGHDTYILNKRRTITMNPTTDEAGIKKVSHINITSALNYGEEIRVIVRSPDGVVNEDVTYAVPELGTNLDYDTADKARATSEVAFKLYSLLHTNPNISAHHKGSSVALWYTSNNTGASGQWLEVEIESGQGDDNTVVINEEIESINGLPKYAVAGTRISVVPDPTTDKGKFYMESTPVGSPIAGSGYGLEECIWKQSRSPVEPFKIDNTTMPVKCTYNPDIDEFQISRVNWADRITGDNESVPKPDFVDSQIQNISYFQKRLVLLSENNVIMSETDDTENFWIKSALQLTVADTVSIASSAVGIDTLKHVIPHNRDLLVFASNAQFKISGSNAITPQTVSMTLTTRYDCLTSVAPVDIGNAVYFPFSYGTSVGIQRYVAEKETGSDTAESITHHVVGYIKGDVEKMAASPNLEMLALTTTESANNELYIYEQFTDNGKQLQQSWSKWVLQSDERILDIEFDKNQLIIITRRTDGKVFLKKVQMYSRIAADTPEIYLDDLIKVTVTDGQTVSIPTDYFDDATNAFGEFTNLDLEHLVVIGGTGTDHPMSEYEFTIANNLASITIAEPINDGSACTVYVGRKYTSKYRPTRPFVQTKDGTAITSDRIRIAKFIPSLVETNRLHMKIISDYVTIPDQEFNSKIIDAISATVGTQTVFTGDHKFSYSQDAALAEVEFYCDNWMGCSIVGLSWEGQHYKSSRRM